MLFLFWIKVLGLMENIFYLWMNIVVMQRLWLVCLTNRFESVSRQNWDILHTLRVVVLINCRQSWVPMETDILSIILLTSHEVWDFLDDNWKFALNFLQKYVIAQGFVIVIEFVCLNTRIIIFFSLFDRQLEMWAIEWIYLMIPRLSVCFVAWVLHQSKM